MRSHIAFALLAIFGAAQAGKKIPAVSMGSGYTNKYDHGAENSDLDMGSQTGEATALMVNDFMRYAEEAEDEYAAKAEYHRSSENIWEDMAREDKNLGLVLHKQSQNAAAIANEALKNADLHRREAADKDAISKEYARRAQRHDRVSKNLATLELDSMRKEYLELEEHKANIVAANYANTLAVMHQEATHMYGEFSNMAQSMAQDLMNKAEYYDKLAREEKDKGLTEKEQAKANEAKGKEEDIKAAESDNEYHELTKKLLSEKYFQHEALEKAENERYLAEHRRIRGSMFTRLSNLSKRHADFINSFIILQNKNAETHRKWGIQKLQEKKTMLASLKHMLSQRRMTGQEMYTKNSGPHSNVHGTYY